MSGRALVVGPHSMLGARLVERLTGAGWSVVTAGRRDCDVALDLGAESVGALPRPVDADVLFGCAAAFGDDSPAGQRLNERVNSLGCQQLVDLAALTGCARLVFAGTCSSAFRLSSAELSSYGFTKLRGEQLLEWGLRRRAIAFTSVRFPQLYDERGECVRHQAWFGRVVTYAGSGRTLRLPGGSAVRNFLHVEDAVSVMLAAVEESLTGVLTATHPEPTTYEAIAHEACALFRRGGTVEIAPEKAPFRDVYFPPTTPGLFVGRAPRSMMDGLKMIAEARTWGQFGGHDVG